MSIAFAIVLQGQQGFVTTSRDDVMVAVVEATKDRRDVGKACRVILFDLETSREEDTFGRSPACCCSGMKNATAVPLALKNVISANEERRTRRRRW